MTDPAKNSDGHSKSVPDYNTPCENCGTKPTVDVVENGAVVYHSELCGACFFGEADMIDPSNW